MKNNSEIRKVLKIGKFSVGINIPSKIAKKLNINANDLLIIKSCPDKIIIKKYNK